MHSSLDPAIGFALFRQFAEAARHGLPLHEVAGILSQDPQSRAGERAVVSKMASTLADGNSLSNTMEKSPQLFATETAQWLALAEQKGALVATLDALAGDYEVRDRGRSAMRMALTWPLCLAVCVGVLFVVLAAHVIPAFKETYATFGGSLPGLTRFIFAVAGYSTGGWWLWLPVLALLVIGYVKRWLPAALTSGVDAAGGLLGFVRRLRAARFVSRLLGLLRAHPGDAALQSAAIAHLAATTDTPSLAAVALRLHAGIAGGSRLSEALAGERLLPRRLSLFAQLGEKMQDLSAPLAQLCGSADIDQQLALARFERGAVLLLYLVLGLAVGTILIAVYLPIFSLGAII
jgi:type IV pilus assembly protein PilC